nr:hypothetical protein CFP56_52496 [Quercus suber]
MVKAAQEAYASGLKSMRLEYVNRLAIVKACGKEWRENKRRRQVCSDGEEREASVDEGANSISFDHRAVLRPMVCRWCTCRESWDGPLTAPDEQLVIQSHATTKQAVVSRSPKGFRSRMAADRAVEAERNDWSRTWHHFAQVKCQRKSLTRVTHSGMTRRNSLVRHGSAACGMGNRIFVGSDSARILVLHISLYYDMRRYCIGQGLGALAEKCFPIYQHSSCTQATEQFLEVSATASIFSRIRLHSWNIPEITAASLCPHKSTYYDFSAWSDSSSLLSFPVASPLEA